MIGYIDAISVIFNHVNEALPLDLLPFFKYFNALFLSSFMLSLSTHLMVGGCVYVYIVLRFSRFVNSFTIPFLLMPFFCYTNFRNSNEITIRSSIMKSIQLKKSTTPSGNSDAFYDGMRDSLPITPPIPGGFFFSEYCCEKYRSYCFSSFLARMPCQRICR